ncbi:hypothetical protein VB737_05575 [Synechococcus sp. BA-120 BA3]|nr:hypothetical protein [Synechococcus sp. BA-120 BA3]
MQLLGVGGRGFGGVAVGPELANQHQLIEAAVGGVQLDDPVAPVGRDEAELTAEDSVSEIAGLT